MGNKEPLETDKKKNVGDNTKDDNSENFKKKLKDISNTDQETKQTNVLENKKPLKTDKTENVGDNTKEDHSENSKEKPKNISNTDKETYE